MPLSYVWGNPSETESIVVDGVEVQITTNLQAAVQEIRQSMFSPLSRLSAGIDIDRNLEDREIDKISHSTMLWIDALCIYVSRQQVSCHRFWRHLSPFLEVFIFFPSRS
jgi:hypothetical protein